MIRGYKTRNGMHRATREELLCATPKWGAAVRLTGLKNDEKKLIASVHLS